MKREITVEGDSSMATDTSDLQKASKARFTALRNKIQPNTLAADAAIWVGGTATFITIVAVNHTDVSIEFSNGTKMQFAGWSYGLGLGGGTSLGGGVFDVSPDNLAGDCSFVVGSASDTGGAITIDWWRGSLLLGTFTGAAIGVGISVTGGNGTWKKA